MTRTLVLHAGLPKTATTTIQNALWRMRDDLLRTDQLLYPSVAENHTNSVCTVFLDNPLNHISNKMAALRGDFDVTALKQSYLDSLNADFARPGWNRALISAEGVSNLSAQELTKLRDWVLGYVDDIEVLFWTREPLGYVRSVIQQLLKGGETLEKMFEKPPLPGFRDKLSNAIAVFGRDKVRVEDFGASAKVEGGVAAAFADQIGLSAQAKQAFVQSAVRENESISYEAAMMLDHLNRARPLFGDKPAMRVGNEVVTLQNIRGRSFFLPPEIERRIYDATRADVRWLNETFGLSLYQAPFDPNPAANVAKPLETVRSSAMVISNLLNNLDAVHLTLRAIEAHQAGDRKQVQSLLDRAFLLSPHSKIIQRHARMIGYPKP